MSAAYSRRGIRQRNRPVTASDLAAIRSAVLDLKSARAALVRAGAHHAADAVRRALKAVEGAERHALGVLLARNVV